MIGIYTTTVRYKKYGSALEINAFRENDSLYHVIRGLLGYKREDVEVLNITYYNKNDKKDEHDLAHTYMYTMKNGDVVEIRFQYMYENSGRKVLVESPKVLKVWNSLYTVSKERSILFLWNSKTFIRESLTVVLK